MPSSMSSKGLQVSTATCDYGVLDDELYPQTQEGPGLVSKRFA